MAYNTTHISIRGRMPGKLWSTAYSIVRQALIHEGPYRVLMCGPGWKDQKHVIERVITWSNKQGWKKLKSELETKDGHNTLIITEVENDGVSVGRDISTFPIGH